MTPAIPESCWLHPAVQVRASSIAGLGLFATESIPIGAAVSIVGGRVVDSAELADLIRQARSTHTYVDTITIGADRHLVLPAGTPNGKGNHSCDPNAWWSDAITLVARRDIAAGEEVTNDYATSTAEAEYSLACACGSPRCRSTVSGTDWRRPELRDRYGDHWVPAVLALIEAAS